MASHTEKKRISPDPDVLGLAVAFFCATVTMALGFWRGIDGFAIAVRVGIVFVVSYAAVFVFVKCAVRIVVGELVELNRQREEEEKAQKAESDQPRSESG